MKDKMVNKTLTTTRTTPVSQTAASCKLPNHKLHSIPLPLVLPSSYPKKKLSNADFTPNYDANPPFSTSTLQKKTEIADQLALNRADEGVDIDSSSLIEGFRPGQYIRI